MIITTSGYTDFLNVVSGLGSVRKVFYLNNGSSLFIIYAVVADGRVMIDSSNLATQPSTFASDFPTAVALNNTLTLA